MPFSRSAGIPDYIEKRMKQNRIFPGFRRDLIAFHLLAKVILSYFGVAAVLLTGQLAKNLTV